MTNETQFERTNFGRPSDSSDTEEVRIFSASGRIGRIRYIAYTVCFTAFVSTVAAIVIGAASAVMSSASGEASPTLTPLLAIALALVAVIVIVVWTVIWTVRRSHDFNTTGWLSLLLIVPLVPFIFWFIPGTRGSNGYGLQPAPGGTLVAAFMILPIVFFGGILAAIAIPAYHDYTQRAQIGEAFTSVSGAKMAIAEYAQTLDAYPENAEIAELELNVAADAGKYIDSITVSPGTGVITVRMKETDTVGPAIAAKTVVFSPPDLTTVIDVFRWSCTSTAEQKFLPKSCVSM